jgi:hypothetical protein
MLLPTLCLTLVQFVGQVVLPPGPAGTAWSSRKPDAPPSALSADVARCSLIARWDERDAWTTWAGDVLALRDAQADVARARQRLALSALSQGRSEDAWDHFAALPHDDGSMQALLPYFLLGRGEFAVGAGESIAPALPPLARPSSERVLGLGRLEQREMRVRGLSIGAAVVDLCVAVQYDGVQVDVEYKGGASSSVAIVPPQPMDFELSAVYVDWERQPSTTGAHTVRISSETPTMTLYARYKPVQLRWSMTLPSALDAQTSEHGFEITLAPEDLDTPRVLGFADALARLTGRPAALRATPGTSGPAVTIALDNAAERPRKERALLSLLERFASTR